MSKLIIRTVPVASEILAARVKNMRQTESTCKSQVQWWETETVSEYRRKRIDGDGFPRPMLYPDARTIFMKGRDDNSIELRIIKACENPKGVMLHFHAGGFVIGSAKSYDNYLKTLSEKLCLVSVSVEYRLAPEHSFPAAENDAVDAVKFATMHEGEAQLGGPLRVLAGESAGAYLAIRAALSLSNVNTQLSALICSYGIFDMSYTPSLLRHKREAVLSSDGMRRFIETYMPGVSLEQRKQAMYSPVYERLNNQLPPALFICGTEDPLVDDSILMATNWGLAGNSAEMVLIPGAWHAFTLIPAGEASSEGISEIVAFTKKCL